MKKEELRTVLYGAPNPMKWYFHHWLIKSDEGSQYTMAFLENEDGKTQEVHPSHTNDFYELVRDKSGKRHTHHKNQVTGGKEFYLYYFFKINSAPIKHPTFADCSKKH